jgi:DNA-binding MarR family transcriptional regulator
MTEMDWYHVTNEIFTYAALLARFFSQSLEERLQNYGVPMTGFQHGVLRMLQSETLTISTLSQRMGLDPSAMVRMIDSLERKGLVVRGTDPHDRRRNPIQITPKGIDLAAATPVISDQDLTFQALQSLGEEETILLRDLLLKVIQQFPEGRLVSGLMSGQSGIDSTSHDAQHHG